MGGSHNSKQGVFNYLPTLLNQFADGSLVNLAVVVDADSEPDGGYQRTYDRVTWIVKPIGYSLKANSIGGLIFEHEDGLTDFGLWVMPDNTQEGMLEDWLKECIHHNEQALFDITQYPWSMNYLYPKDSNPSIAVKRKSQHGWLGRNSLGMGFIEP